LKLSVNIIANLIGRIWAAGIGIVLVPQYIKFMGIEAYGLVGFYGTLIGTVTLLDLGLSTTINRELTKAVVEKKEAEEIRSLVFTIEIIYWAIGLVTGVLIVLLAPLIAQHWVNAEHLPSATVTQAVMVMGIVAAFQWPISLYNGGLTGLGRQVTDNVITIAMTTIRSAGVILLLWLVSPTLKTFFIWQAATSLVYVLSMRFALWHYIPKSVLRPQFSKVQLKLIWRFAAGMTGISVTTFFLMQIDKILLSKILPLSQFAYYTLAFTVASGINMVVAPINIAVFPQLTTFVAAKDTEGLVRAYHKACTIVASVIFPIGLILVFFAQDILMIWTKNPTTVKNIILMVQILVTGSVLNSLMVVPYLLMLAKGETRYPLYQNIIASIILVPMLFWWVHLYGVVGGTLVWLVVNIGYVIFSIPLIHKIFMKGELATWYFKDTLIPLLPSLITVLIVKIILTRYISFKLNSISMAFLTSAILFISMIFLPEGRAWFKRIRNNFSGR
jgi:O-antigen/teichoic acid export membrane protein